MSYVIDGILVAVMLFCIVFYSVKGFVSSVVGLFRFWIAAALSGVFSKSLSEKLHPMILSKIGLEESGNFFSKVVNAVVSSGYISRVIAFALVFVVTLIAVKILEIIMNLLTKLPVMRFLNRTLGSAVGVVIGAFWVQLLAIIIMALAELLAGSVEWLSPEIFNGTVIARFLYEHNVFRMVFEALTGLES